MFVLLKIKLLLLNFPSHGMLKSAAKVSIFFSISKYIFFPALLLIQYPAI